LVASLLQYPDEAHTTTAIMLHLDHVDIDQASRCRPQDMEELEPVFVLRVQRQMLSALVQEYWELTSGPNCRATQTQILWVESATVEDTGHRKLLLPLPAR
jgi:hypothetical protein